MTAGGAPPAADAEGGLRLRISYGGAFEQDPDTRAWTYAGGATFLETLPRGAGYAELMWACAERAGRAVSARFQLPGEALHPDALISLAGDADAAEAAAELGAAAAAAAAAGGAPPRLRVFLAPADEEAYTPEDLAAEAAHLARGKRPPGSAGGGGGSSAGGSAASEAALLAAELSSAADTEAAWEAGFRAGREAAASAEPPAAAGGEGEQPPWQQQAPWQQAGGEWAAAAAAAAEAEWAAAAAAAGGGGAPGGGGWAEALARRARRLARIASGFLAPPGGGGEPGGWAAGGHGSSTPRLAASADGLDDVVAAAAAAAVSSRPPSPAPAGAAARAGAAPRRAPGDPGADPEFAAMFESKYEAPPRSAAPSAAPSPARASPDRSAHGGGGGGGGGGTPPKGSPPAVAAAARPRSPDSALPRFISAFGDDAPAAAAPTPGGGGGRAPSPLDALPSHISVFGLDDDAGGGGGGTPAPAAPADDGGARVMSVVRAGLPAGDVGRPDRPPRPPPPSPAGDAGLGPGALPAPPAGAAAAAAAGLPRSPSLEALMGAEDVQRVDAASLAVVAKIGEGAFGEVSLCECPTYGLVAVKWTKPGRSAGGRHWAAFWREAEMCVRLNHPSVVRTFGLVTRGPPPGAVVGIMTEFVAGGSLARHLRAPGAVPPPLRARARLGAGAANGLAYLHARRILHGDVKPENLLVDGEWADLWAPPPPAGLPGGGGPSLKVADFGLSVVKNPYGGDAGGAGAGAGGAHDLRGTLPYMAPEVVAEADAAGAGGGPRHAVTEKADIYSLGVVLWEMLTLAVPHAGAPPGALLAALGAGRARLPVPPWCEPEWAEVLAACWAADPGARPSARALAARLEAIRDAP